MHICSSNQSFEKKACDRERTGANDDLVSSPTGGTNMENVWELCSKAAVDDSYH